MFYFSVKFFGSTFFQRRCKISCFSVKFFGSTFFPKKVENFYLTQIEN